jgi:hypothetical protein
MANKTCLKCKHEPRLLHCKYWTIDKYWFVDLSNVQKTNMKLEQQVTSLELSKNLKELGVKQESLFYWEGLQTDVDKMRWRINRANKNHNPCKYSAFTVAELGEMLPFKIIFGDAVLWLETSKFLLCWTVQYTGVAGTLKNPCVMDEPIKTRAKTEADARIKMLMYLVEKKLVTLGG